MKRGVRRTSEALALSLRLAVLLGLYAPANDNGQAPAGKEVGGSR